MIGLKAQVPAIAKQIDQIDPEDNENRSRDSILGHSASRN